MSLNHRIMNEIFRAKAGGKRKYEPSAETKSFWKARGKTDKKLDKKREKEIKTAETAEVWDEQS